MADKNLCLDCGLCCDGTLYSYVALQETDDREKLAARGIALKTENNETGFDQPCSAYRSHCCSIYEARPMICREYRCALLRQHEDGKVSLEEARSLINDTITLRDRVRRGVESFLGIEERLSLHRLFGRMMEKYEKMGPGERGLLDPAMLLDVGTMRVLLSKRFDPQGTKLAKTSEDNERNHAGD